MKANEHARDKDVGLGVEMAYAIVVCGLSGS
jgi:hypothetical protein